MSFIKRPKIKYDDGRTKQAFKDSCDINKILKKHAKAGTLSHLTEYGGQYGDFSGFDFFEAQNTLARAREIFDALPSEVRKDFGNQPANFFEFANDPANVDRLDELLPQVAEPGSYFPRVDRGARASAPGTSEPAQASVEEPAPPATEPPPAAPAPSEGA